jgi:hypothetical protein
MQEIGFLRNRVVRFIFVFGIGFATETLQYFGVPIFGNTFDPLDYVMFAAGVLLAFAFESAVVQRYFSRVAA